VKRGTTPPFPWICLVTNHTICADGLAGLERAVAAALVGGVNVVQLREKAIPARELYDVAVRLRRHTSDAGAALVVNDRLDVALAVGADGVQLGAGSLFPRDIRRVSSDFIVGGSVHGLAEARDADREGADYLIAGTIFPSASHPGQPAHGPRLIREIAGAVSLPIVGIGGITAENAAEVMAEGAVGVAVIREILAAPDPTEAARRLVEQVRLHSTCN
jgi:thiamine-phosphate pyrophosphorylase